MSALAVADVGPVETRVLLALVRVYARDGRATVRSVAKAANRSLQPTHVTLRQLRELGLVAFEEGLASTLRPLVQPVRTGNE